MKNKSSKLLGALILCTIIGSATYAIVSKHTQLSTDKIQLSSSVSSTPTTTTQTAPAPVSTTPVTPIATTTTQTTSPVATTTPTPVANVTSTSSTPATTTTTTVTPPTIVSFQEVPTTPPATDSSATNCTVTYSDGSTHTWLWEQTIIDGSWQENGVGQNGHWVPTTAVSGNCNSSLIGKTTIYSF